MRLSEIVTCQTPNIPLLCAYKALIGLNIEDCNHILRRFLIKNCLFLPDEIPQLIEKLGLSEKFDSVDFKSDNVSLYNKEFEMFKTINSPKDEYKLLCGPQDIKQATYPDAVIVDDRFERAVDIIKERAKSLENDLKIVDME